MTESGYANERHGVTYGKCRWGDCDALDLMESGYCQPHDQARDPENVIAERAAALIKGGSPQGKAWRQARAEARDGRTRLSTRARGRLVHGWAFMDLPDGEVEAIRRFLESGDPAELPPRWHRDDYSIYER